MERISYHQEIVEESARKLKKALIKFNEYEDMWSMMRREIREALDGMDEIEEVSSLISLHFLEISYEIRTLYEKLCEINEVYVDTEWNAQRIVDNLPVNIDISWQDFSENTGKSILEYWNGNLLPGVVTPDCICIEDWLEQFICRWMDSYF